MKWLVGLLSFRQLTMRLSTPNCEIRIMETPHLLFVILLHLMRELKLAP
jgi:hypothetical protein